MFRATSSPHAHVAFLLALALVCTSATPALATIRNSDRIGATAVAGDVERIASAPDLTCDSGILVTSEGRELWSRGADKARPMASTTKIMTSVLVIENDDMDARLKMTHRATSVGESGAGIEAGTVLTVRTLLRAMLVKSANEAAFALAEHAAGSAESFVAMMNDKAQKLGLKQTRYSNPHGLDAPGHHTSARDLASLALYAMRYKEFRDAVSMKTLRLPDGTKLHNTNELLGSYEGMTGIKTGWTGDAGYCVVVSATRGGVSLVAVVMGDPTDAARFQDAARLLDWGFKHYSVVPVEAAKRSVGRVPVTDFLDVSVTGVTAEATSVAVFDLQGPVHRSAELPERITAPVTAGQRLGTVSVTQGDTLLAQIPIVSQGSVRAPAWWQAAWVATVRMWRGLIPA